MGNEHDREHVRIQTDALVDFTGTDVLLFHKIENLSLGGMSIFAASVEPIGTRVYLTINFPAFNEVIEVEGEVVWCREQEPKEMGIKFCELTKEQEDVMNRYIAAKASSKG